MRALLGIFRLLALILYTGTTFLIYFIVLLPLRLLRIPTEPWRNLFMRNWARTVCFLFNIRVRLEGPVPKPPFFLVSNHLSYVDIVVLNRFLKTTFVAKQDVQSWPFLGFMVKMVGVIFVNRERRTDVARVNRLMSKSLNSRQGMILFPEGTSSAGREVLPFHSSLLQLPATSGHPVHVATLHYKTAPRDQHALHSICFFGNRESFTTHVWKFAKTTRIDCTLRFHEETVCDTDRKLLAEKLRAQMISIFEPTSPQPGPEPNASSAEPA
ncbi:MAG: lysophospholipid acyltransferase family protein [Balneolaceae bacterium]